MAEKMVQQAVPPVKPCACGHRPWWGIDFRTLTHCGHGEAGRDAAATAAAWNAWVSRDN